MTAGTLGNLAIGGNTLYVTGGHRANTAYSLTLGSGTLSGSPTFNVADNGSGIATLTLGAINDGGVARTLTKAGSGLLILSGSDTYSGGTAVDAGSLAVTSSRAFPSGSGLFVGAGGNIRIRSVRRRCAGRNRVAYGLASCGGCCRPRAIILLAARRRCFRTAGLRCAAIPFIENIVSRSRILKAVGIT